MQPSNFYNKEPVNQIFSHFLGSSLAKKNYSNFSNNKPVEIWPFTSIENICNHFIHIDQQMKIIIFELFSVRGIQNNCNCSAQGKRKSLYTLSCTF